uniref:Uncharacterized protein LOC104248869 n=1 Tax=Nicotiana sylvestris TaxID=4096 RepID=A0A1U7YWH2_NICSY|nr:PREDICTED: uncharacterized protein LOC104248869 [Nicotiana sylvestris]
MALMGVNGKMDIVTLIWNNITQPKHRFIVWLVVKYRLLTQERLAHLQIQVENANCCLCNSGIMETPQHLFGECSWFKTAREALLSWAGIQMQHVTVNQVFKSIRWKHWKHIQKEIVASIWSDLVYHTWRARN